MRSLGISIAISHGMWDCNRRRVLAAILAVTLCGATVPAAASVRAVPDDALALASAGAVQGRVVAVSAQWDDVAGAIYTYVTIDVVRSWGFESSPARVVVKQLGGIVGGTALVVGGQARFEAGEDVLVFLDVRPRDNTLSVAGLEQGKWVLTGSADAATSATREIRGHDNDTVVTREYRSTLTLDALAALAGTRVRASGVVFAPAVPAPSPLALDGRSGPAYSLLTSTPARWHEADSDTPVYVDSQVGGHAQFAGGGLTQLGNASAMWRAAGSLRLETGVQRTARCFYNNEYDGRISVSYGDPCGEISDTSSTLAIGGAYYSSVDQRTVNGVTYWKMTKGMVVVDNTPSKFSSFTTGCYEEMLVHELGHAIGFGHAASRPAIMYPSISSGCFSRTTSAPLGSDDLAGMAAVYPDGGVTPPPPPPPPPTSGVPGVPTGLTSTVSGSTVALSWSAPASGGPATGYQLYAGTAPGAANLGAIPVGGTGLVVPGVPNGVYYVRVVATNSSGASAPTADVTITVGPAAPGAPRSLTAVSPSPGVVSISWLAPSSGGSPTSYVLIAGHVPGASTYQIPVPTAGLAGSGVPAGVYYVRVVALNGATPGPASAEVALTVR